MANQINRLINTYVDPYGELYLYLRERLMKGMKFHFSVKMDQAGLYVVRKDSSKKHIPKLSNLIELCVDFVTNEHSSGDYLTLKNREEKKLIENPFFHFAPKYKDYARRDCYKPVILLNSDLVQLEIKTKNEILFKTQEPKFQIIAKEIFEEQIEISDDKIHFLMENKEVEIFIKIDPIAGNLNTRDDLLKPEAFFDKMFSYFINRVFLEASNDDMLDERLKIFGLQGYSIKQIKDMKLEAITFKDCLKMELLADYAKSSENNAKVLKKVSDKYEVMVEKIDKHLDFYQKNEVVKEFEWDF